ncbi:Cytochrome P450 monooxygenase [Pseudocercospora fuligena]|uniref:Cytochrome P450 monooxygenase n=1 Tax=Pseudocercospora fuligena TaxID=685502 RepID=A0A8H6VTH9_9PEZI|nr:Cytochrome P450 monooxygenase [Pseudocercospora fuligena]
MEFQPGIHTFLHYVGKLLLHPYAFYIYYLIGALLAIALSILAILVTQVSIRIAFERQDIPWAGLKNKRFFPKLRACLRELSAGRGPVNEGYEKYSKHGKPFITPALRWSAIVLPPSSSAWAAQQPESVLSGNKNMEDTMGPEYLLHGPNADSVLDFSVIRRNLTRQITKLSDQVLEEIKYAFDEKLGLNGEEWREFSSLKLLSYVSFRAANRIFVGLPLCRDAGYEKDVMRWTSFFGISTIIMGFLLPKVLHSTVMPVVSVPARLMQWWATRHLRPKIQERLSMLEGRGQANGKILAEDEKPNDMLQWIIDTNSQKQDPRELDPANIAGKMILFNIFATATTSTMAAVVLSDILAYEKAADLLSELREEAERYMPLAEHDATAVRSMTKLDSVVRESLRFNPMNAQGMVREVVAPGGVTTPDGLYLAQGSHIQCIVSPMQRDVDIFGSSADEYDPLRHHRQGQDNGLSEHENMPEVEKQKAAVQINHEFLSWGLGRHACPGRFFAVHVMKIMLGHLLLHYDMQPFEKKPEVFEIGEAKVPSDKQMIKVKRRPVPGMEKSTG